MGIHLKNNAVGLDKEINHLQEWLYDRLLNDFAWSDYECYGRAYLNKNPRVDGDKKNIFEVSVNGKDYALMARIMLMVYVLDIVLIGLVLFLIMKVVLVLVILLMDILMMEMGIA